MQSALFVTLQHKLAHTDRASRGCQETMEKPTKRRKTYLKDWKTRLNYLLQHNSSSSDSTQTVPNKKDKTTPSLRPSPAEAKLWAESFDALLGNKYAQTAFRAFLKSEFSEENIDFWLACEDFKKTKSSNKLSSKARKIYNEYIATEAPKEINIDFNTKEMITTSLQAPTHSCFDAAQKRVYSLMVNNSYPRFIQSDFYQDLCRAPESQEDGQRT